MSSVNSSPPRLPDKLLKWICKKELHEEIIGDLHELWLLECRELPRWKGNLLYLRQIILFFRPFIFKKRQNSNYIMLVSHLKYAWRIIGKHKAQASLKVLSLSIGIASFIFIFVYVRSELSYDQFHKDAELIRRVAIDFVDSKGNRIPDATTPPALAPALKSEFPEVASSVRLFPSWGNTYLMGTKNGIKYNEESVMRTDSTFFDIFSFNFLQGTAGKALNDPSSIVLTESAAIKYFGKLDVVGESITHFGRDKTYRVTAVIEDVPRASHFTFDFLIKIDVDNPDTNWGWYNFYSYIKLSPGTNEEAFEKKLQPFYDSNVDDPRNQIYSQRLTDIHLKSHLKWELAANGDINNIYIFSALGIFILIISCLNFINLTVAESIKRFKEIGVRKVFGANRSGLIGQLIVETILITLLALGAGSILSEVLFQNLGGLIGLDVSLLQQENLRIFLIICGVIVVVGLLSGVYPAIYLSSFKTVLAVKGIVNRSGRSVMNLRKSLLVIQFAISAFMIFGTLVVFKQLRYMKDIDKGFQPEQILVLENSRVIANQKTLKSELLKLPSVSSLASSSGVIGGLNWTTGIGYPNSFTMNYVVQDPGLIETMEMELVMGRDFDSSRPNDAKGYTMIVNETAFKELGLSEEQIGQSIPIIQDGDSIVNGTVIGVVKDFYFTDYRLEIKPFAFFYRDQPMDYVNIKVTTQNMVETLNEIEAAWNQLANNAPIEYFFLEQTFGKHLAQEDRLSKILLSLTVLAFFIAFIGMFAIANITIKDSRKEIAIRKVLGASIASVTYRSSLKFILLVLLANIIAMPIAYWAASTWLSEFVYRTNLNAFLFLMAIGSTLLIAWVIVGYQSFKTAISNPIISLRQD